MLASEACVSLAGPVIQEELVCMLQKLLDDAVLDAICLMLWNNKHYKLPLEDVRFIQPPHQPPQLSLRSLSQDTVHQLFTLLNCK